MSLLAGAALIAAAPASAGDAVYGEYLAAECVTCHGGAGADAAIPSLRSLGSDQLTAALRAYREGARTNPAMQSVARTLGDEEIAALAAYLSGR